MDHLINKLQSFENDNKNNCNIGIIINSNNIGFELVDNFIQK